MFKVIKAKFPLKVYRFGSRMEIRDSIGKTVLIPALTMGGDRYFTDVADILQAACDKINAVADMPIDKEIEKIIRKYSSALGDDNKTIMSDESIGDKGFFLVFIKKDMTQKEGEQLTLSTLGNNIGLAEIRDGFTEVFVNMLKNASDNGPNLA